MLAERDRENMALLTERLDEDCVLEVPYLDEDVHDIGGLAQVNRYLFAPSAERQADARADGRLARTRKKSDRGRERCPARSVAVTVAR